MRSKYDDGTPIEWIPVTERFPGSAHVKYVKGAYRGRPYVALATWCGDHPRHAANPNVWESALSGEGGIYFYGVTHWAESMSPRQRERAEARHRAHTKIKGK